MQDIDQSEIPTEPDVESASTIEVAPEQIIWEQAMLALRVQVGDTTFMDCFDGLNLIGVEGNVWYAQPRSAHQAHLLSDPRPQRDLRRMLAMWTGLEYEAIELRVVAGEVTA